MTPTTTHHHSAPTSTELIAEYIEFQSRLARKPWRPETVRVRTMQLRRYREALGAVHVLDVTEEQVLAWHAGLRGKPETLATYASAVRGLYQWLSVRRRPRLRLDDPTVLLERPVIPESQPRPMLDRHFELALACAVSDPEIYMWLGLMGCCGLRCCEIAWLNVADVEEREDGGGLLHLTGKGGKQRTVPVGAMLMLTMQPFLRSRGPVFTRPSDGKAHSNHSVSQRMNEFLADVGVPKPWTAHSLRHRFGTDYHALDVDLYRQAKIMGHASVDTTRRYTEVSPVEAAEYVERLTVRRLGRASERRLVRHTGRDVA